MEKEDLILLVVDDDKVNWLKVFEGATVNSKKIVTYQSKWQDMVATTYGTKCYVDLAPTGPGTCGKTVKPDFLFLRQSVRGLQQVDHRHTLYAFMCAQLPALNSLMSVHLWNERVVMFAELLGIQKRLGPERFPMIESTFYPQFRGMLISPSSPMVVKVGHAHAGYGKILLKDHHQFQDMRSVMALHSDYCSAEPFLQGECDLRIQKIGTHHRVFERRGNNWKTNTGTSVLNEVEVADKYRFWADESSKILGGLDILAVDVIRTTEGKEYIIEVNDCTIGLAPERTEEDHVHMRELLLQRWEEYLDGTVKSVPLFRPTALLPAPLDAAEAAAAAAPMAKVKAESDDEGATAATSTPTKRSTAATAAAKAEAPKPVRSMMSAGAAADAARKASGSQWKGMLLVAFVGLLSVVFLALILWPVVHMIGSEKAAAPAAAVFRNMARAQGGRPPV